MDNNLTNVTISTDGACSGNPGPGGYGVVMRCGKNTKELSGKLEHTTNNRAELIGPICALKALKKPCNITFRCDSLITCNAINDLESIHNSGYKTKTGARRANSDLIKELRQLVVDGKHVVYAIHVKGHDGDPDNERCDELACLAITNGVA